MTNYAQIRRLAENRSAGIDGTFGRLTDLLRGSGMTGDVQCTILTGDTRRNWVIQLRAKDCQLRRDAAASAPNAGAANLEIITSEATWWEVAEGSLSPLDAFVQGRLRIRGDTEFGSRLLRKITDGNGAVSICGG